MNPPKPKLARLYRRVSTAEQQNSMDVQDARIADYVKFKQLTIAGEYADPDVSGRIPIGQRSGGYALLRDLQPGDHLVVAKLDRLGRNAVDILRTIDDLTNRRKVTIHIIDLGGDSFSTSNPYSRFVIGTIALFAELEVERIRGRIQEVMTHKFERHELCGTVPYGYDAVGTGRFNEKNGVRKEVMELVVNTAELAWVRQMAAWRASGLAYNKIAAELNKHGVPTKIRGTWQSGNVARVLSGKHTARLLGSEEWGVESGE
jgi:DNA invertase Pin-like site-specific DNA recombinase